MTREQWTNVLIVAAAVALVVMVAMPGGEAHASNMGFKMNKSTAAKNGPDPQGVNLISLPYQNPYQDAQDICVAFGLSAAPAGTIEQVDASAGAINVHGCGLGGPFALADRVGVVVKDSVARTGILVGSHVGNPPGSITLFPLAVPPQGNNHFPVPYHTTAVTAEDLCVDLGLPAAPDGVIQRIDASGGAILVHGCGLGGAFPLVLGQAVIVQHASPGNIVVPPGRPSHF